MFQNAFPWSHCGSVYRTACSYFEIRRDLIRKGVETCSCSKSTASANWSLKFLTKNSSLSASSARNRNVGRQKHPHARPVSRFNENSLVNHRSSRHTARATSCADVLAMCASRGRCRSSGFCLVLRRRRLMCAQSPVSAGAVGAAE